MKLTKEELQLIYLMLHKTSDFYNIDVEFEDVVLNLITKIGKEIDKRTLDDE